MKLSQVAQSVVPSSTLSLVAKAQAMKAQGLDVISLSAGELDMPPPRAVRESAKEFIDGGKIRYTAAAGIPALRSAIAEEYAAKYGLRLGAENVIVTAGAKQAVFNAVLATVDRGDQVIIPAPYWVSYPEMVKMVRGEVVVVHTRAEDGFKITPEALERHITERTAALILNTPSNPTGAVYTKEEISRLLELARKHSFVIISDEIYESLVLEGEHASVLHFGADALEYAVMISGASKSFAMTGWRIGWALGHPELVDAMTRLQAHQTSNACTISQHAVLAALREAKGFAREVVDILRRRRDRAVELLRTIPGFAPIKPAGAFYIFCDVRGALRDRFESSAELAEFILERALVAVVPGEGFGAPGFLRFSIAVSEETFAEAAQRIKNALS